MSVRKTNKPNVWVVDWLEPKDHAGNRKRNQRRFHGTKAEALEIEQELRRHPANTNTNPTIGSVWSEYIEWCELHQSKLTVRQKRYEWPKLREIFGNLPVSHLTRQTFQKYQQQRIAENVTPQTINKELNYLMGCIRWMVDQNYCNQMTFKPKALKPIKKPKKIPTREQMLAFVGHFEGDKREMVLLMLFCGLRSAEARMLKWTDLDFKRGEVQVFGKGSRYRTLPVPGPLMEMLEKRKASSGFVFINPATEKPYEHNSWSFRSASEKAGCKITPHMLRHYFATTCLESGSDIRTVQELLGHAKVTTTEVYTHISTERKRQGIGWTDAMQIQCDIESKGGR